ncbi:MAG: tRNA (guanosine(46)-N7)-methyltransferase TrmB [Betaproteobacteria bacterium]|nr:tRNA (guanosine(46)-N7)-methyltransferase TrmB [Betaproteobacteria bacterium]MBL8534579.1 tRNA (guanosine(46)-N7)-methyltransferase TrmB [Betaproteobacteria bacterium]
MEGQTRPIRSFVLRQSRTSNAQRRAVEQELPRFGIPYAPECLDLDTAFGRRAPRIVEIGFGMGESTADYASRHPEIDFLGMEVHTPGVGNLLQLLAAQQLTNVRIIQHDAVEVLNHMIPECSLRGIHIFFPDPWPKKRHHKRRLIQGAFVELLASRLEPEGYVHLATDWEEYATQMLAVLSAQPRLTNTSEGFAPRPESRPLTKFESRGLRLGHGVWDLVFRRHGEFPRAAP